MDLKPIPFDLLFTYHSGENLEQIRRDVANYYFEYGRFEREVVTLMEVAYIFCIKSKQPLDDNETHARHNRLCRMVIENKIPYIHKDIRNKPYFINAAFEYWVLPEIAVSLIKQCGNSIDKTQKLSNKNKNETTKKDKKSKLDPILLKFLQPYVDQSTKPKDFEGMMIKKHTVPSDYDHNKNPNSPHEKCYKNSKAKPNEIKIAFVKKNESGNYDLYFYWNMPTTDSVELKEGKKSFKSVRKHYHYLEKIGHLSPLKTLKPT